MGKRIRQIKHFYYYPLSFFQRIRLKRLGNHSYSWINCNNIMHMERLPSKSFSYNSSTARRSFEKYFCKYYEHHSKEIIINYIKKLVYLDYVDYHFFRESIKIQLKGENYIIVNDNAMFNGIYNNKIPQNKNISIFILLYRLLIMVIKSISHLIITIRTKNKVKSKPIIFLRKKPYSDLGLFSILKKYIKKNNQDCIGLIYRFNKEGFYNEFIYLNKITGVAFLIIKATMQTIFTVIIYYKDIFRKVPNMYFTRIVNDIATAREHGDLKENAEYHAAKEEQGFIEGRIQEIESKLSRLQIIDVKQLNQDGRCVFGTTVSLLNLSDDSEISYQIVGEDEADIGQGKISCHSPIAKALMGNEEGDEVTVKAPKGDILYEILEVQYI